MPAIAQNDFARCRAVAMAAASLCSATSWPCRTRPQVVLRHGRLVIGMRSLQRNGSASTVRPEAGQLIPGESLRCDPAATHHQEVRIHMAVTLFGELGHDLVTGARLRHPL